MKRIALLATIAALTVARTVHAQTDAPAPPPSEKCRALPDAGDGEGGGDQAPPPGDNLTDTLADCGGVLTPPATGDGEITETAPAQGQTPIVKPDDLPAQQPPAQ